MRIEATEFLPLARREAIITKKVDGELLVYDITRDKAHCLNETAAAVWRMCDGQTSVSALAERLADGGRQTAVGSRQTAVGSRQTTPASAPTPAYDTRHLAPDTRSPTPASSTRSPALSASQQLIWLALDQLRRSHLLEKAAAEQETTSWPGAIPGLANMTRREAVRRIGLGAAIALPIVMSMTAPTPVEAAVSCGAKCHPCGTSAECCGTSVCTTGVSGCPSGMRCT